MTADPKGVVLLKKEQLGENAIRLKKRNNKNSNSETLIQKYVQK